MITKEQLLKVKAPFVVESVYDDHAATITGFAANDPLGVGGGLLPNTPIAYFEGGGWCLLPDLMEHWDLQTT